MNIGMKKSILTPVVIKTLTPIYETASENWRPREKSSSDIILYINNRHAPRINAAVPVQTPLEHATRIRPFSTFLYLHPFFPIPL